MQLFLPVGVLKMILPILAIIAGVFVITTKNAIISVFNLIVLYILVAFYLIYIGVTYLGISYIVVYIGAIAILFLFVIMMIDIEVVEKRNNNYLPLLFLLLGVFLFTLKNILFNIGVIKMKSLRMNLVKNIEPVKTGDLFVSEWKSDINDFKVNEDIEFKTHEKMDKLMASVINSIEQAEMSLIKGTGIFNNISGDTDIDDIDGRNYNINENLNFSDFNFYNKYRDSWDFSDLDKLESDKLKSDKSGAIKEKTRTFSKEENRYENEEDKVNYVWNLDVKFNNDLLLYNYQEELNNNNYLLITPNWDLGVNRVTQISAIGDVLYTVYHSYIYIISVLLLLGMIGAIILTADNPQEIKIIKKRISSSEVQNPLTIKSSNRLNGFLNPWIILKYIYINILTYKVKIKNILYPSKVSSLILPFFDLSNSNNLQSEGIIGNLFYFIIATLIIAALLLFINSYFSLSIKYLDKGGGFECGFTSFVQTRERFNVIFYRVSLLFLVFDLEIILIFPYTAVYQKYQNISKNNVLAFLYILIVGFIYELKEGALNIVKKAHTTEINNYS